MKLIRMAIIGPCKNTWIKLVRPSHKITASMLLRNWAAILLILSVVGSVSLWRGLLAQRGELDDWVQSGATDAYDFNRFMLTGVEETTSRDNRITTSLSADQVLHRNRQSSSIIFYNLNEIYNVNLSLNLDASREPPLNVLFSDIPFLYKIVPFNSEEAGQDDASVVNQDIVTRIVADGFQMKITFDAGRVAAISADRATLMTQEQNILFEGGVAIQDSVGHSLSAPQAIWSKRHHGILFPKGYSEQEPVRNSNQAIAFFKLGQDGMLTKIENIPVIQLHQDIVDQLENLLWVHLFQKLFGGFQ